MNTILTDEGINAQAQSQQLQHQQLPDAIVLPSPKTTTPSNEINIGDSSEQYRVVEGTN